MALQVRYVSRSEFDIVCLVQDAMKFSLPTAEGIMRASQVRYVSCSAFVVSVRYMSRSKFVVSVRYVSCSEFVVSVRYMSSSEFVVSVQYCHVVNLWFQCDTCHVVNLKLCIHCKMQ